MCSRCLCRLATVQAVQTVYITFWPKGLHAVEGKSRSCVTYVWIQSYCYAEVHESWSMGQLKQLGMLGKTPSATTLFPSCSEQRDASGACCCDYATGPAGKTVRCSQEWPMLLGAANCCRMPPSNITSAFRRQHQEADVGSLNRQIQLIRLPWRRQPTVQLARQQLPGLSLLTMLVSFNYSPQR